MTGETIKSFLVGLGFDIDSKSLGKFNKSIADASLKVAALYAGIQVASAGIFASISSISKSFEDLGYEYHIISPMINKTLILRNYLLDAYRRAGIDITKVVKQSILFNLALSRLKFTLEAVYKSVGAKFFPLLTRQMDIFRLKIFQNMPKIQQALEKFVKFIFKAFQATVQLGMRVWEILGKVWDFFKKLDDATAGWSTAILAVLAAWKLLNLGFIATPLGMLITGFTALLALWDDFKTFKEGGQSLINWGSDAVKMIVGMVSALGLLATAFVAAKAAMIAYDIGLGIFNTVMAIANGQLAIMDALAVVLEAPFWAIAAAIAAVVAALTLADSKWQIFGGHLSSFFTGVGSKVLGLFGAEGGGAPVFNPGGVTSGGGASGGNTGPTQPAFDINSVLKPAPLVPQNTSSSQKVQQETNINIMGSPDANATGKAVAGEQDRVNSSMTRNLRGAVR